MAKAAYWTVTDVEARAWEQTGLDTLVVHAVNDRLLGVGGKAIRCRSQRNK